MKNQKTFEVSAELMTNATTFENKVNFRFPIKLDRYFFRYLNAKLKCPIFKKLCFNQKVEETNFNYGVFDFNFDKSLIIRRNIMEKKFTIV